MREPKRCPGCGFTRFGSCPFCYPQAAEREKAREQAEFARELEQRRRRAAGMILCPEHDEYDGCIRLATPQERASGRLLTWQEAMDQLRARYVSP